MTTAGYWNPNRVHLYSPDMRIPTLHRWSLLAILSVFLPTIARAQQLPRTIGDQEFWRLVTDLSETGGVFPQQFMSNEDSAQFVIPSLKEGTRKGGIYIGVGSEQNFTYLAAAQPRLAFIVDIRRDNLLEHLMYKALFELSDNRADFISRLFSRKRPAGIDANASVKALFDAYRPVEADAAYYETNLRAVMDRLARDHQFPLTEADRLSVTQAMNAFRTAGPFSLKGFGDTTNPTYADLMAATDLNGRVQSYLASEENYRIVRELERQNLIVPVVGDFAGDKAIVGIGRYLREHDAIVNTFYVSNVERYLFEQGDHGKQFYVNAATLPADSSSTIVRSVTSDISRRLGIPIPDGPTKWRSFLYSMEDSLKGVNTGRIQNYAQLFEVARR
jgi:hypothetical protein